MHQTVGRDMKRGRGPLRIAVCVGLAGALLVAGVASASTAKKPAGSTAIKGSINVVFGITTQPAMEILIANFKRVYPNVTVNAQWVSAGSAGQVAALLTPMQAGSGPDVFLNYGGNSGTPGEFAMQKAGYLMDLNGQPWVKRMPAWIAASTNVGGHPYGINMGVGFGGVIYNADKFKQLGLTSPKTFSDLLALCATIRTKSPGTTPITFPAATPSIAAYIGMMMALNDVYAGDPYWDTQRANGQKSFAGTPGWHTALQRILDMKNANCFSPGIASDQTTQAVAEIGAGQALMTMDVTGRMGQIALAAGGKTTFSIFPMPGSSTKVTRLLAYLSNTISVNQHTSNKAAALAFLNFMVRPAQNRVFVTAQGPGTMTIYDFQHALWPSGLAELVPWQKKTISAPFFTWPTATTATTMGVGIQGLLTGQKSVDQVLADMDYTWGK